MNSKIVIAVLVVIAIILGFVLYQRFAGAPRTSTAPPAADVVPPPAETTAPPAGAEGANSVVAEDQPTGSSVRIQRVTLTQSGFVVIKKVSGNQAIGGIIGNSNLLSHGASRDVAVSLYDSRGKPYQDLKAGDVFIASLVFDNGDGKYGEADVTLPAKDDAGTPVSARFSVR